VIHAKISSENVINASQAQEGLLFSCFFECFWSPIILFS